MHKANAAHNDKLSMASESPDVTASDIGRLHALIFPSPVRTSAARSLTNGTAHPTHPTRWTKDRNHCESPEHSPQSESDSGLPSVVQDFEHSLQSESDSGLPSVVQDSEDITNIPRTSSQDLKLLSPNANKKPQAMGSQLDLEPGTQPISQSFYREIIEKGRSALHRSNDQDDTSQRTYEEGDSGHIDLASSFVTRDAEADNLEDSEPVDISPARTQTQLTQYPESQRFKTPATVGKKRTYNGDIVDTPAPARNPLVGDGRPTPRGVLGLSQAFAATQAASSPLSNDPPTGPQSDRPSPNIDLEARPVAGVFSSPLLRPISGLRRTITEPASRYVSMKQSQAERLRQERIRVVESGYTAGTFDDEFDEEDSLVARRRRQKEREQKTKQELRSLSSPILPAREAMISSPPRMSLDKTRAESYVQPLPPNSSSIADMMDLDEAPASTASEAETEQEDDTSNNEHSTSPAGNDEDKENNAVLVPKTGPRHRFGFEREIAQVDASPSLRHTAQVPAALGITELHSSGPYRIMDSQPSQSRPRAINKIQGASSSASDVIDFVGHSLNAVRTNMSESAKYQYQHQQNTCDISATVKKVPFQYPEDETENEITEVDSELTRRLNDTLPETDSDARAGLAESKSASNENDTRSKESTNATNTDFETAPTFRAQTSIPQSSQASSPTRTAPPGRKRRRMLEINADPSPLKSQSQPSFNAEVVLQLDHDEGAAELLASSPSRRLPAGVPIGQARSISDKHSKLDQYDETDTNDPRSLRTKRDRIGPTSSIPTPDTSQEIIKPGRHTRTQNTIEEVGDEAELLLERHVSPRRSIYDIQASPEQKTIPQLRQKITPTTDEPMKRKRGQPGQQYESSMQRHSRPEATENQGSNSIVPVNKMKRLENGTLAAEKETETGDSHKDVSTEEIIANDMVLAYYKGEPRGYYPARVLERISSNKYQIQWEGYDPEEIDLYGIKALDLRLGDTVKTLANGFPKIPYVICGFKDKSSVLQQAVTDIRGYQTLIIAPKKRKSLSTQMTTTSYQEIPISSIYLDVNMWAQMRARDEEFRPVDNSSLASGMTTPIPQTSVPSTPSSRNRRQTVVGLPAGTPAARGKFENMAFAISYDDIVQKNALSHLIQTNGGMIIQDSFHDLLEPESVTLKPPYRDLGFTALLTDRHSRKEKYMQALALGIPCLSGRWIEASLKCHGVCEWQSYLLPAGESAELDNATRSRVLPTVDSDKASLKNMLELRPNLLENATVIVVVGRGKAEIKRLPYLFLIKVLGACHIHKFPDITSAKGFLATDRGKECDWIFVDDKDVVATQKFLEQKDDDDTAKKSRGRPKKAGNAAVNHVFCRVAGNELIVQSLILGRLYEP